MLGYELQSELYDEAERAELWCADPVCVSGPAWALIKHTFEEGSGVTRTSWHAIPLLKLDRLTNKTLPSFLFLCALVPVDLRNAACFNHPLLRTYRLCLQCGLPVFFSFHELSSCL